MLKTIYFLLLITIISINISCSKKGGGNNAGNNSDPVNKPVVTNDVVFTPNLDYPSTSPECSIDSPELSEYLSQHPNIQVLPNHNCSVAFVFEALELEIEAVINAIPEARENNCLAYLAHENITNTYQRLYDKETDPIKKEDLKAQLEERKQRRDYWESQTKEYGQFNVNIGKGHIIDYLKGVQKILPDLSIKEGKYVAINHQYKKESAVKWLKYELHDNLIRFNDNFKPEKLPKKGDYLFDGKLSVSGSKICNLNNTSTQEYTESVTHTLVKELNLSFPEQIIKLYSPHNRTVIDKAIF